jgi:hypothetical protein
MVSTNSQPKRGQKHQNSFAYVPSKHNPHKVKIAEIKIINCCQKCVEVLQYKQRFGKYKPLKQPTKCIQCQQKTVLNAYHALCGKCAKDSGCCAKCQISMEHEQEPDEKAIREKEREEQEMLKSLSERVRRSYIRKQERGDFEGAEKLLERSLANSGVDEDEEYDSDF